MALSQILTDGSENGLTVANKTNASFTATDSNTSDIVDIEVVNGTQQTAIDLNTAKVGITTQQSTDITTNLAKISYTDAAAVSLNTAKVGVTNEVPSDPSAVTGADAITNMMSLTQAEYDAITPDASTFYVVI